MTRDELLTLINQAAAENWTELDLSGKGLTELPPEIGKLTQLETLILGKVEEWEWVEDKLVPTLVTNELTDLPQELLALENLRSLNLSGNPFKGIPNIVLRLNQLTNLSMVSASLEEIEAIAQLTHLTQLDLSSNQISHIPEAIAQLINLTELHLSSNQISDIPKAITQLTNLTRLGLASNQIGSIPEVITELTNLTWLYLPGNKINALPKTIAQLTNLTTLDLHTNQLGNIEAITQLTNLATLHLFSNQISEIPESIAQLTNLTTLHLFSNQISEIPESIAQLTNLTTLNLRSNQISEIPESIAQLTKLTTLYLSNNQISEIPESIAQLTKLTTLSLSSNQISEIPEAIAQLANLKELYLQRNQLSNIPQTITKLTNLTQLVLEGNQISEIPATVAQLTNLTALNLGRNQISEIPAVIAQLKNLTSLSLWGNQISEIPAAVAQLTKLTTLVLSKNQFSCIPETIARLTNLTILVLEDNQIGEIPEAIAQLTELEELRLRNNQIKEIPVWLEELPKLKKLDLRGNPLPVSPEVLGKGDAWDDVGSVEEIFNYCRLMRSGEALPLNEAKLLLVGQGSVGKTSLINRLIENTFNPNEEQTDGLNVSTWDIHVNSKDVRLNVWDFGGQEIYHATHQFFLTKRSLYLLVCNCRTSEEENRIEYWLKLVESFGDKAPVIIVGNKKDEQPFDINQKALRNKYPNIKAIIETSCQTGDGIDDLRHAIAREIAQLREVYDLLPLSWFEVKEQLSSLQKDVISYSEYVCLCATKSITEELSQHQLIDLLHNLGLVLNFRAHPILQNTSVLNPRWVTEGIYALLSDETLRTENKGILGFADLDRVLDCDRYPVDRHRYLTDLMQEFQLCYPLPDCTPLKFLIPGLLPKDEPETTQLEGDTLEFQYQYRILPESVISRFIVLANAKIHNHTHWRSGAMLAYTEGANKEICNIARVKSDPEDKKIFISISGQEASRRLFLGIIREIFSRIHNSFANLEVGEFVPVPGHPDHPPLDYQELLGLESMGETEYPIGKLRIKVNLRQLLDGYESSDSRRRSLLGDRDRDLEYLERDIVREYMERDRSRSGTGASSSGKGRSDRPRPSTPPRKEPLQSNAPTRNGIFISYSHADKRWLTELQKQLKPLIRNQSLPTIWDDTKIQPGDEWRNEIEIALVSAKVAILLVSQDFLNSDFIAENELPPLLNAAQTEGLIILWIPIRYSSYKETEIAKYQAVHSPEQPLASLKKPDRDRVWVEICKHIKTAAGQTSP